MVMNAQGSAEGAGPRSGDGARDTAVDGGLWSASDLEGIIDRRLRGLVPDQKAAPQLLHKAISYSLLAPGKRWRPMITLLTSFQFGRRDLRALDCACAIEMIHAASLVMDDLPAMDDSAIRRGQPTTFRQFGEDIAVLSSIALLNMAFGVVASSEGVLPEIRVELVQLLSNAVGSNGLVGGQIMDLRLRSDTVGARALEKLNQLKTGALFVAAAEAGARIAGAPEGMLKIVRQFALEFGHAFQIADDVLDGTAHTGLTGKDTGKDFDKPTLARVLGQDGARQLFESHAARCRRCLSEMSGADNPLAEFVEACLARVRL